MTGESTRAGDRERSDPPGPFWTHTFWDALRFYYWSLEYVGLKGIPEGEWRREGDRISIPARFLDGGSGLYVRERKQAELETKLHRHEVTLNQVLRTVLSIADDAVLSRLLGEPLRVRDPGPFERPGDGIRARYGWGPEDNEVQPDGYYIGPSSVIALETRLAAKLQPKRVLQYAALMIWEERLTGPKDELGLLFVVPGKDVGRHWTDIGLAGPGDAQAVLDHLPGMSLSPGVGGLIRDYPDHLRDVLARLRLAVISWSDLDSAISALRLELGTGQGDGTLDRLLAGLANQIAVHEGTGVRR